MKSFKDFIYKNQNYVYTFAGNIVPLLVGFLTVPFTLEYFGVEVLGFIAICWLLVGFSGIFDLGLSRSMTQIVARLLPSQEFIGIRKYFWTTFSISLVLSLIVSVIINYYSLNIISLFKVSDDLLDVGVESFKVLSLSIPFILLGSVLVGFLTAYNSFDIVNVIKVPIGILMMLAPVISYYLNLGVIGIMYVLLIARVISFFGYFLMVFIKHDFLRKIDYSLYGLNDLMNQGLWMTLSNVISPIIVNFDRVVLGTLISVQAVAYYSTVYDVITKLHIIPTTFVTVLFPLFAYNSLSTETSKNNLLISKYIWIVMLIISPVIFIAHIWSFDLISIWLSPDFAEKSYKIAMILLIGVFWNTLAQIPFTFLQANGNSSKTALFHIMELLIFLPMLYWAVTKFGIAGAALAWSIRVILDFILLFYYTKKITGQLSDISAAVFPVVFSICLVLILIIDSNNVYVKSALTVFMCSFYFYFLRSKKNIFYNES